MNLPDRTSGTPDDFPATENFTPTPAGSSPGASSIVEPAATLAVSLSKTVALHAAPRDPARILGPRYSRLGLHARGGLGEVFLAEDKELPREVALKEIRADRDDDQSRLRFVVEGTITGSLEHPGIVPVYSLGTHDDGRPYYAMRMIRGQTLQEAIAELQPVDFASAAFRQLLQRYVTVCQTLQYAHDRGVIHRDLKPANIMVGSYGETLVVDWGLAKVIGQAEAAPNASHQPIASTTDSSATPAETEQGVVLGTPAYMSPEQAAGDVSELTPATDIYALGATFYHLLTGQNPLKAPGRLTNPLERVQQGDIASPRTIAPHVPRPLQAICQKAMALKPADRYASARDLATDLERWLADEPITAYREPLLLRSGRWLRKHPGLTAAGATSLTLLLISAIVISAISHTYSRQLSTAFSQLSLSHGELAFANKELKASHHKLNATNDALRQTNLSLQAARDLATKNANAAKENEQEAREREAETKTVLDFVVKRILAAARPEGQHGGLGRNVLLRDAILAAAPHVATSFEKQPLIRTRLHQTLGNSFRLLGENAEALQQFQAAEKLLIANRGPFDKESLDTALDVAVAAYGAGDLTKSRALMEANLKQCKEHLGETHATTLNAMHNLANVYEDLSLKPEALKLRDAVYRERIKELGPNHPDTLRSMNNLAYSLLDQGKLAEAVKLAEETVKRKREVIGLNDPETLGSIHTLANMYSAAGRDKEALDQREQVLKDLTDALGPENSATLEAMQNLANSYVRMNRHGDALKLYMNAASRIKDKLGADHPKTLSAVRALALEYAELGQNKTAIPLLEDVLKRSRTVLGPHHPQTIDSMRFLANAYWATDREQEGLELHIEAYQRCRDSVGPIHPETLNRMFDLAIDFNRLEVYPTALKLRQAVYEGSSDTLGAAHPETLLNMNVLAQSQIALRQGTEALALLKDLKVSREAFAAAHPRHQENACYLAQTLGQLGDAEQLCGDYAAANKYYEECLAAFDQLHKEHRDLGAYFDQNHRFYQLKAGVCQKIEDAVRDISIIDQSGPGEVGLLLEARLHHMRRTNDFAGAVATAEMFESQIKRGRVTAYDAGVAWSLVSDIASDAALRNQYGMRAIELLQRVKPGPRGRFKTAVAQAYAFHFNPDLDPLREREAFKAILEKLPKMGADPIMKDK